MVAVGRGGRSSQHGVAGTIEKVELVNIMCHRNLMVELIDQVNFVTGMNGSGKSSILAALMLVLGGRARDTNRGESLKSLVSTGQNVGEITIRLRNTGPDAYKPELFGDTIIIQRRMLASGTGSFKIKNNRGQTQSTKKSDITLITEHFNIEVGNPLCILTQDQAKKFLQDSSPEEKYRFFHQGTRLSDLIDEFCRILDYITGIDGAVPDLRELRNAKKTELSKANDHLKLIQLNAEALEDVQRLRGKVTWAHVCRMDRELRAKENKKEEEQELLQTVEEKIVELSMGLPELQQSILDLRKVDTDEKAQLAELKQRHDAARDSYKNKNDECKKKTANMTEMNSEISSLTRQKVDMEQALKVASTQAETHSKTVVTKYEEEKRKLEAVIKKCEENTAAAQERRTASEDKVARYEQDKTKVQEQCKQLRGEQTALSQQLHNLSGGNFDRLMVYGQETKRVVEEIGRNQWRGITPIGPVGLHVTIKDPHYSATVESVLNPILSGFLVTTDDDLRKLRAIIRRHYPRG